ncbi:tetratricopeptide repeat protein [Hymenobacter cavernae]|uniref:tetratricopeptide repeat protein n=1 Tax=Hymenobacter cavernae TaxID=2044852 RepID=UPI00166654F9|nr:tetratricopeptide repeat protein [Hymenobacter cavernae]
MAAFPRFGQAQAVVEELGKLYASGQLAAAISLGEKELRTHGEQNGVSMFVGRAYTDKQQFQAAIPYLTRSLTAAGSSPDVQAWSEAYLGTCYYALQDYAKANQAFEHVVAAAATKNVTAYATRRLGMLRAQELAASWRFVETAHYRFHLQAPEHLGSVEEFTAAHERAYERSNRFFQAPLPRKIDYYVWDERALATKMLGQNLGFTVPELLTTHALKGQTKGHETAHVLTFYGLQPSPQTRLINEGIAVCFDQTTRDRMELARQATGGTVDVWQMWEKPQTYSDDQLYPVGGALLEYLLAHSPEADVKQLLREQTPELGRKLFSKQIADFEKELSTPGPGLVAVSGSFQKNTPSPAEAAAPVKLDAALVNATVERQNAADKFYKILVLLNGVPIPAAQMQKINPQQIRDVKVLKTKAEITPYTDVELNGIILITAAG